MAKKVVRDQVILFWKLSGYTESLFTVADETRNPLAELYLENS